MRRSRASGKSVCTFPQSPHTQVPGLPASVLGFTLAMAWKAVRSERDFLGFSSRLGRKAPTWPPLPR